MHLFGGPKTHATLRMRGMLFIALLEGRVGNKPNAVNMLLINDIRRKWEKQSQG